MHGELLALLEKFELVLRLRSGDALIGASALAASSSDATTVAVGSGSGGDAKKKTSRKKTNAGVEETVSVR